MFRQTLIEVEQRKLKATANASASHIQSYFNSLENAVKTIGRSHTALMALESFEKTFYKIEKET
uniref:hypothetical protein n=1 Tax=Sulfurimonas sp. TaxID=2022749 RepID=UPI002600B429